MEQEIASQVVGLGGVNDFSILQLFIRADFVVKSVIIILLASSVYSWALIFEKYRMFKKINESSKKFEDKFWKSKSAEGFSKSLPMKSEDPMTLIFQSAMTELVKTRSKSSVIQSARVERILEIATDNEIKKVEKNFTSLATIGSTAPFIGLFGTVWGIMNAFAGIDTTKPILETVTPHIAEALVATAIGLLAAIPAVISYNRFSAEVDRLLHNYETFMDEFSSILHRKAHSSEAEVKA